MRNARIVALLGDSITTDHISPAGAIQESSPAGQWLLAQSVQKADFNSYGARLGNHAVLHIDTPIAVDRYRARGLLPFVLPQLLQDNRV